MFVDRQLHSPTTEGNAEIDALEYLADLRGSAGLGSNVTYGHAYQTLHNWGGNNSGLPHDGVGVGVPISTGEWHLYAAEWEPNEVRFYIDGCLRNRIHEGDRLTRADGTSYTFKIPRDQEISLLIGNPASGAGWLPAWYRASANGGTEPRADFKPTELEVDYVRVYSPNAPSPNERQASKTSGFRGIASQPTAERPHAPRSPK
jgi:beta-glucanase (GH16 family)